MFVWGVLSELVALLAPPACVACRRPASAAPDALCPACRRALPWLGDPRCPRCGLPGRCRACPARAMAFAAAWAPVAHAGPARAVVAAFKFEGALALCDLMAAAIAAGAPPGLLSGATLVPVPLHPRRRRARGFDQALLLARALGRRTGRPVAPCLARGGPATRQLGARRGARLAAPLAITAAARVPRVAVLVDDVHTTGATFDAAARALRDAGARRVACLSYARAV